MTKERNDLRFEMDNKLEEIQNQLSEI